MISGNSLLIALVIVGVAMLALKLIFPHKSMGWYIRNAKLVIALGFLVLIAAELIRLKLQ